MNRINLIQYLINKYSYSKYLEIGTQKGNSFFPIKCRYKIAVDPKFRIRRSRKLLWYIKNIYNLGNSYFEVTSDHFFLNEKDFLRNKGTLDIVLIDGLHTFEAALNDALNSLNNLSKNGIIIMHDCFPPHKSASVYATNANEAIKIAGGSSDWTGEWCGDTWKAIAYLKKQYPLDLEVHVLDFDYGLGIVKLKNTENIDLSLNRELMDEVDMLTYEDLINDPKKIIGLKNQEFYRNL